MRDQGVGAREDIHAGLSSPARHGAALVVVNFDRIRARVGRSQ
jgi:hypothetical protein